MKLSADLRARQVIVSTAINAPGDRTTKGRVSWLLKQLATGADSLKLEARVARRSSTLASTLGEVRSDPSVVYPEKGQDIKGFVISSTSNMGLKRDNGRGSFADGVVTAAEDFYADVLQKLRAWNEEPPKLKKEAEKEEPIEEVVAERLGVEPDQIADIDTDASDPDGVAAPDEQRSPPFGR
jgi:hypothetical protein